MSSASSAYDLWPLVLINATVFVTLAFSFTQPHTFSGALNLTP
jgi:hypothetical protein